MESEIKELKSQLYAAQSKDTSTAAATESATAAPSYPSLNFHGFGDINYEFSSNSTAFPNRFWLGELDFYISSQISDNASIITENVASADPAFNNWNLESERVIFDYNANKYLNIVAGRFHTELGYYNTEFHHGTWFQMDAHRPWFLEFEDSGGILPVHMVGLSVDGAIPSGSANLHYFAQIGNGRSYDPPTSPSNPTQAVHVDNGRKAVNVAITAKPTWAPGFQFGAGAYHQTLSPQGGNMASAAEYIFNADVIYSANGWNFLNEAFLITHTPNRSTTHRTAAAYSEVSKKMEQWTPYFRFTYVNSPASDPVYNLIQTTGLRYGPTYGLRFDFADYACLKLQYEHNYQKNEQELAPSDDLVFQVGFTF